jgi:hypothetical protein
MFIDPRNCFHCLGILLCRADVNMFAIHKPYEHLFSPSSLMFHHHLLISPTISFHCLGLLLCGACANTSVQYTTLGSLLISFLFHTSAIMYIQLCRFLLLFVYTTLCYRSTRLGCRRSIAHPLCSCSIHPFQSNSQFSAALVSPL